MISAPDETVTKPTETVETPSAPAVEETTAPVTTLPERPRETTQPPADNVEAIHAKRPYETPLFFKEEQKPPKMPKVEGEPAEAEPAGQVVSGLDSDETKDLHKESKDIATGGKEVADVNATKEAPAAAAAPVIVAPAAPVDAGPAAAAATETKAAEAPVTEAVPAQPEKVAEPEIAAPVAAAPAAAVPAAEPVAAPAATTAPEAVKEKAVEAPKEALAEAAPSKEAPKEAVPETKPETKPEPKPEAQPEAAAGVAAPGIAAPADKAATADQQAAQAPEPVIKMPEQAKMAAGKAEQSARDNLAKFEQEGKDKAEQVKAEKAEKRKSGFFGWLKKKVKSDK